MSDDLERLLREARRTLPRPAADVTGRAREAAIASAVRPRRLRERRSLVAVAALLVATGLGVGLGALIAPSGIAGPAPAGVGFLPERGWSVLQNGGDGTAFRPALAVAANVALSPADDSDGLPYATLQTLPSHGVVLVVGFFEGDRLTRARFPRRALPLDIRDASPLQMGAQVRPEQPLGQYQLLAAIDGYLVDVNVYFGTPRPSQKHFDAAQRQLDRLVVGSAFARTRAPRAPLGPAGANTPTAATRVVDRTFVCTPDLQAGVRVLYVIAQSGFKETRTRWKWLPSVTLSTDGVEGPGPQSTTVAGISAGTRDELGPARTWVGVDRCKPSKARVPLTPKGLPSRSSDVLGDTYGCAAPPRVLLRLRVTFTRPTALVRNGPLGQLRAQAPVESATLAVRRLDGRPFAYATVAKGGAARFWAGSACTD